MAARGTQALLPCEERRAASRSARAVSERKAAPGSGTSVELAPSAIALLLPLRSSTEFRTAQTKPRDPLEDVERELSGRSSRRPGHPGRLSQNRTSAVHIRLFGTTGCYPRGRPVHDLSYPSDNPSCTGAPTCRAVNSRHFSTTDMSPRSAKYALRSP